MSTAEARAVQMFAIDCSGHQLTVRHDDGLYRHPAFRRPDTSLYWFDLITWPGHLTFVGDMGSYTFARTDDMLGFFLSGSGINPGYWAEKLQGDPGGRASVRRYSEDLFRSAVSEAYSDHLQAVGGLLLGDPTGSLWAAIEDEVLTEAYASDLAMAAARDFVWAPPNFDPELQPPAVVVHVLGEPIPQGSMRAIGRGRMKSDNVRLQPWRDTVAWRVHEAMAGAPPLTGPLEVRATFVLPRPPSAPKRRWAPEKKPDLDKLLRALLDAATAGGAWVDDAQVVAATARKVYATAGQLPQAQLLIANLADPEEGIQP